MDKKQSVITNFIWRFMERGGTYVMNFIVSVVLARLLDPSLYGTVALVTAITTILQVFVDSGMANSLIQKKDTDDLDYSSVFYFNLAFCLLLYAGLFFCAPWISRLYRIPELTPIVRVLGLTIVVSGVKNVQQAYVAKTMQFRRFFFATLGGTVFSAVVGITLAYLGYGVWALVFQQLLNVTVNTAILWLTVGWKPKRMFSWKRLGGLISYGWKLLVSQLLDTAYLKLYQFIIGLRYSTADLAFYNRGDQFPNLIMENTSASLDSVLLPVLSSEQDDRVRVREMTRRAVKVSTFVLMPLMAGLAACAEPLVRFLLTEKWLPCVPYMQLFCLNYAFWPVHTANLNAIKAVGRSDIFLKLEIIKKVLETGILLVTMRYGVMAITLGLLASGFASIVINAWPNRRLLDLPFTRQLLDVLPALLLSLGMAAAIWPVTLLGLPDAVRLLIMVPAGVLIYVGVSALLKLDSFTYVLEIAKRLLRRGKTAEKFLREALDSMLGQQTDFPFEVLVSDDVSTDSTRDIIRAYEAKYPDVLRPFYLTENLYSQGRDVYYEVFFPNARGKYTAFCEGDDCWTDPTKLQRQVDFLEAHPDYTACVHNTELVKYDGARADDAHAWHTSSLLARTDLLADPPDFYTVAADAGFGDFPYALWLRLNGKIRFLARFMSRYRLSSNADSWSADLEKQTTRRTRFQRGVIAMLTVFRGHVTDETLLKLTDEWMRRWNFQLLYTLGRDRELRQEPYRAILREKPLSFRVKNLVKCAFPALHRLYRKRQGYNE